MNRTIEKNRFTITIGVAVALVLTLITAAFAAGQKFNEIEEKIKAIDVEQNHIKSNILVRENKIQTLQEDDVELKVKLAEIETKLTNIETLLIDIKTDLKIHTD